jgi:hypothetical protein
LEIFYNSTPVFLMVSVIVLYSGHLEFNRKIKRKRRKEEEGAKGKEDVLIHNIDLFSDMSVSFLKLKYQYISQHFFSGPIPSCLQNVS